MAKSKAPTTDDARKVWAQGEQRVRDAAVPPTDRGWRISTAGFGSSEVAVRASTASLAAGIEKSTDRFRYEQLRARMPGLRSSELERGLMQTIHIPQFNRQSSSIKACEDCGLVVPPERQRFCSDACSARQRNRDRQKVGNGKSAAENARKRAELETKRHMAKCTKQGGPCDRGEFCMDLTALLNGADALSHVAPKVTPEVARSMSARAGRTSKRSSSAGTTAGASTGPGYVVRRNRA